MMILHNSDAEDRLLEILYSHHDPRVFALRGRQVYRCWTHAQTRTDTRTVSSSPRLSACFYRNRQSAQLRPSMGRARSRTRTQWIRLSHREGASRSTSPVSKQHQWSTRARVRYTDM